jgi:hypothetical protein
MVYFIAIWYILWSFGTYTYMFPFWYVVGRDKNLATLVGKRFASFETRQCFGAIFSAAEESFGKVSKFRG